MKLYCLALFVVCMMATGTLTAQSFEQLENRRGDNAFLENTWELYLRRTQVTAKYTFNYGGTTINMKYRVDSYDKGGFRWHFENPTLGDMIFVLAQTIRGTEKKQAGSQAFGSGFFGWHQMYWNAVAKDRLLVSPGMSFGDYIFGSERPTIPAGFTTSTIDPAGYYFHVGPALMVTQIVGDKLWMNVYTRYDITGRASGPSQNYTHTDGYKNPNFFALGASVQHATSRLCGGINFTKMIDRGPHNDSASRFDISFGYMF